MTTIKQIFLGAAVAGALAGAGSALGPAAAHADDSGSADSAAASASHSRGESQPRGRSRGPSGPAATAAGTERAASAEESRKPGNNARGLDGRPEPAIGRTSDDMGDPPPTQRATARQDAPGEATPVVPKDDPVTTPRRDDVAAADTPARPTAATPARPVVVAAPVAAATPGPAATLPAPVSSAAVVPTLTPAPAAPAPTPLRLPFLPDLPAVPVAPAGSVTVSATSGKNSRYRAASAQSRAELRSDPPVNHVLLIGTDGTNLSKVLEYAYDDPASGFRIAMDDGVTGATSLVGHTTISGPSWTTILTGAWDDKTGVINNLFNPEPYVQWPTVINLIEYNRPEVETAVVADWQYINDIADAGGYPADVNEFVAFTNTWEDTDDVVADKTIALIEAADSTGSTFIFSYQVAVDEEGHLHGGGSTQYRDALINTSENVANILAAVEQWETANPGEEWTVIITTDHGHQQSKGFGHGFQSPNETTSFVIFDGEGDDRNDGRQNLGYTNADITPTIVDLFGIAQRSDFDGVPMQSKTTGIVDPVDLKQALGDAVSMYGYPNIGTDLALGTRTVFASVPYFIDGFVTDITDMLQSVVDQDIFLISGIAEATTWIVQFNGDLAVGVTQALARVVAYLTGAGTIPPSDPPLPAPPAASGLPWVLEANVIPT